MSETKIYHIAVAGAGLLGLLTSWRLLLKGHKVTLFEKRGFDTPHSAAYTAAAMISPMSEVVVSERDIYDIGQASLKLWPKWLNELDPKGSIHYRATGSLVIAHPHDESELDQFYQDLAFKLGAQNTAQQINGTALRSLEPDLASHFTRGLLLPDEAYLDNRHLLKVLLQKVIELGGICKDNTPIDIDNGLFVNGKKEYFDKIFDTRGLGAKPSQTNLRGVRGEVLWVETKEVALKHPIRLMHPRYKLYIVPKQNHQYIVGATEIESEDRSPMSVQSMMELCSALYTVNPAFAEARITELDVNLRPTLIDNMPESTLEKTIDNTDIYRINGLYRHGYLLAPYLVKQVTDTL